MPVCVDASAVLAWLLPYARSDHVRRSWLHLLASGEQLLAPPLLLAECTSVIRGASFNDVLTSAQAAQAQLRKTCHLRLLLKVLFYGSHQARYGLFAGQDVYFQPGFYGRFCCFGSDTGNFRLVCWPRFVLERCYQISHR